MAVIYASHYMEEVSAICSRVAIVDHGRVLATGRLDELLHSMQQELTLRVRHLSVTARGRLQDLIASNGHLPTDEARLLLKASPNNNHNGCLTTELRRVLEVLDAEKTELVSVETRQSNLERLFLELTGHSLRD